MFGGYGQIAHGRSQYGAGSSDVKPQFYTSNPRHGTYNVDKQKVVTFELYAFSSSIDLDPTKIEVSEDAGTTFNAANLTPYNCSMKSKDGQLTWVKILKNSSWEDTAKIIIRINSLDEFGQDVVKTFPVEW